jgi:hypothetical protein
LKTWKVYVTGVGFIGFVLEHTEQRARDAARERYGRDGSRHNGETTKAIYEDDTFNVVLS